MYTSKLFYDPLRPSAKTATLRGIQGCAARPPEGREHAPPPRRLLHNCPSGGHGRGHGLALQYYKTGPRARNVPLTVITLGAKPISGLSRGGLDQSGQTGLGGGGRFRGHRCPQKTKVRLHSVRRIYAPVLRSRTGFFDLERASSRPINEFRCRTNAFSQAVWTLRVAHVVDCS